MKWTIGLLLMHSLFTACKKLAIEVHEPQPVTYDRIRPLG